MIILIFFLHWGAMIFLWSDCYKHLYYSSSLHKTVAVVGPACNGGSGGACMQRWQWWGLHATVALVGPACNGGSGGACMQRWHWWGPGCHISCVLLSSLFSPNHRHIYSTAKVKYWHQKAQLILPDKPNANNLSSRWPTSRREINIRNRSAQMPSALLLIASSTTTSDRRQKHLYS